ncbi:MAG: undecaprenyl-phosphate glucose phosphotransferase [Granulosicoccaceae bacterium]
MRAKISPAPNEHASSETLASTSIDENSQYASIEKMRLDNLRVSANESNINSIFGNFKFRHEPDLPRSHAAIDLFLTILCFATAHFIYLGSLDLSSHRSVALFSALVLMSLSLYVGGMYNTKRLRRLNVELTHLAICWMFAFAAIGLFAFLSKTGAEISRVWITLSMVLSMVLLASIRILGSLGFMTRNKTSGRNIAILGNASGLNTILGDIGGLSNSQLKIANVFTIPGHPADGPKYLESLQDSAKQLTSFVENQRLFGAAIEQVWIVVSENQSRVVEEISEALINSSVDVCVAPDQYTQRLLKGDVTRFGNTDIVNVSEISLSLAADQFKRVFDVLIASLVLLILGIPMIVIAGLIKRESTGPALFRQKRYGVDGREIEILKFRSMFVHSDNSAQQATKNDTRVTRIGRVIRKSSLDELPQLLNVLNGTMSLVGPRPHAVAHNELWRHEIQGYMLRHKVRPGITGWAQINGWRGETDTAFKMQQRVKYDLEYIRNWSPWLDLKILVLTAFVGFLHKNAY